MADEADPAESVSSAPNGHTGSAVFTLSAPTQW